jgi:hypothetical protein
MRGSAAAAPAPAPIARAGGSGPLLMPQVRYNGRLVFSNVLGTINRYSTASSDAYKLYGLGKHLTSFDITEGGAVQNIVGFHYAYAMQASGNVELSITTESGDAGAEAGDASPARSDGAQAGRKRPDVEGGRDQSARGDAKKGRRIGRGNSGAGAEARPDDDLTPPPCPAPFFDPYAAGGHPFHAGLAAPEGYIPHPFPSSYLGYPYPEQHAAFGGAGGPPGAALPPFHAPFFAPQHPGLAPPPGYWPPHLPPPHLPHQPPGFWQPQEPRQPRQPRRREPPGSPSRQQEQGQEQGSDGDEPAAPASPGSHEAAAVLQQLWLHPPPALAPVAPPAPEPKPRKQGGGGGRGRGGGAARPASSRAQTTITMGSSFVKRYFQKILSPDGVTPVSFDVLQNGVKVASGVQVGRVVGAVRAACCRGRALNRAARAAACRHRCASPPRRLPGAPWPTRRPPARLCAAAGHHPAVQQRQLLAVPLPRVRPDQGAQDASAAGAGLPVQILLPPAARRRGGAQRGV